MGNIYLLCLFFFISVKGTARQSDSSQFAFPDSTYRVMQVIFTGNELTKDYIIEHEMVLKKDSLITHQGVQYDINRIYSLRLFTKADIKVVPDTEGFASLIVIVSERWYLYPFPVLGFKDRDFAKFYYGAGIVHNNVGGRNEQVFGSFALGYDPYVSAAYVNPFIDSENNIFFSFRAYYTEQRNRSLVSLANAPNFNEIRWGGLTTIGKRFSLYTTVSTTFEYLNLRVSNNLAGRTVSSTGRDEFFSIHASYLYDTRDLKEYPGAGTFLSLGVSKHGVFEDNVNYQRYNVDIRKYFPVWDELVIAGRSFTSLSTGGSVPNYGHVFFGYFERIRGHFNTILEGEQIVGSTVEVHYPLISPRYIRLDFIPFEQFRDLRYAIYAAAFADAGNTWYRKDPLTLRTFSSGYGIGIHFNLAYSAVIRFEIGIPHQKTNYDYEYIIDLGVAL